MMRHVISALVLMGLGGCATISEGTSQSVSIATDPPGSDCIIDRDGTRVGEVNPTPGSIHVGKSKNDLTVRCTHAGFQAANMAESPKFQGTTFGNILFGGLVGAVVDASSGANYQYPTEVRVNLAPLPAAAAETPLVLTSPLSYSSQSTTQ